MVNFAPAGEIPIRFGQDSKPEDSYTKLLFSRDIQTDEEGNTVYLFVSIMVKRSGKLYTDQ